MRCLFVQLPRKMRFFFAYIRKKYYLCATLIDGSAKSSLFDKPMMPIYRVECSTSKFYFPMKKTMTLLVLLCTLCMSTHATLIFHESFNQDAGQLTAGRATNCNDSTKWWSVGGWSGSASSPTKPIMVTEGGLSYEGYVDAGVGNKAQLDAVSGTIDVRRFVPVTSGSVYAAAIINIESANTEYIFGLCEGNTTYTSRLFAKGVEGGFQLSIAKGAELKTAIPYTDAVLTYNTNYLIVVEYVFKEGAKNDSVNLWVNPTKSSTTPTLVCDTALANAKNDMTKIAGVFLRQNSNGSKFTIDEIKVATSWNDLFEGGDTPDPTPTATITAPSTLTFTAPIFVGETYTSKFTVSGSNLTGDITLACSNAEVVLDKTTITKADAEAEGGVEVTATLTAATAGMQTATITLSSENATDVKVTASWQATALNKVATIAALKAGVTSDPEVLFLYTGEAVITYYEVTGEYDTPVFYVEDATGSVRIYDYYSLNTCKVGDKIKDFMVVASEEELYRGLPFSFVSTATVVSSGNEWTPQVVTLKDLQDNAADYLMELVKVENVTLDNTEADYKAGNNAISQNGTSGAFNLTSDNTLVGTAKPATADIVGISYYTSGYNIRVRTAADIVAKTDPTSIETISLDQLTGEYTIYTVSGQRTDALQAGVNIIRQGDKTYKVIR